jgi:hypothetical protein
METNSRIPVFALSSFTHRCRLGWMGVMAGIAMLGGPRPCRASSTTECSDPRIQVVGELSPVWSAEVGRVCAEVGRWSNVDPRVRLWFWQRGTTLVVDAMIPDGRMAERQVPEPADLQHTVEALAKLPPAHPPPAEPITPPPAAVPPDRRNGPGSASVQPSQPQPQSPSIGVELGAVGGGRVEGTPSYVSAGFVAWAGLRLEAWILGLQARWDPWQTQVGTRVPDFDMDTVGAGLMVARRFAIGRLLNLDAGLTTWMLNEAMSFQAPDGDRSGVASDVRLGALARAHVGRQRLRLVVSAEAELSPIRARSRLRIDPSLPPLPSFGCGLALGASWGGP